MYSISRQRIAVGVATVVALGIASGAAATAPAVAGAVQNQEQALAGSWVINEDLSDELRPQPGGRDGDGGGRGPRGRLPPACANYIRHAGYRLATTE